MLPSKPKIFLQISSGSERRNGLGNKKQRSKQRRLNLNSILESPFNKQQHPTRLEAATGEFDQDGVKFIEVGDGHNIGPYNVSNNN